MSDFKAPESPQKVRTSKIRFFDGISRDTDEVIRRFNDRGWDISNTIANLLQDFDINEYGSIKIRSGSRKIFNTGQSADIDGLLFFSLNGGGR